MRLRKDSLKGPKVYIPHIKCERRSHLERDQDHGVDRCKANQQPMSIATERGNGTGLHPPAVRAGVSEALRRCILPSAKADGLNLLGYLFFFHRPPAQWPVLRVTSLRCHGSPQKEKVTINSTFFSRFSSGFLGYSPIVFGFPRRPASRRF